MRVDLAPNGRKLEVIVPFHMNHVLEGTNKYFNTENRSWRVDITWSDCEILLANIPEQHWTPDALEQAKFALKSKSAAMPSDGSNPFLDSYPYSPYPPMRHQRETYSQVFGMDCAGLFFEQGLGKTKATCDIFGMWQMAGVSDYAVIIVQVSLRVEWTLQFDEHYPLGHHCELLDTSKEKRILDDDYWASKPGLKVLVCGVESLSQGKAHKILTEWCKRHSPMIAVDESSCIKNPQAARTKRVIDVGGYAKKRLILTGTPLTRGLENFYSQFQFLDERILGMRSFFAFRNKYCVMGGFEGRMVVGYRNVEEFLERVKPFSFRYEKADCLDLPPKTFETRRLAMSKDQARWHRELKKEYATVIDDYEIESDMALQAYLRMSQIVGGFYPVELDDGDTSAEPIPGKNPKKEEVRSILEDLPDEKNVIIWCRFKPEVALVADVAEGLGRRVGAYYGDRTEDEKAAAYKSFREGEINTLILTYSGARGLNLQGTCSLAIYYSLTNSFDLYVQSQDRIHRTGQTESCHYIVLECEKSIDSMVLRRMEEIKELADHVSNQMKR